MATKMSTERIITLAMGALAAGSGGSAVWQNQHPPDCAPAVSEAQEHCNEDCLKRERAIRDYSLEQLRNRR